MRYVLVTLACVCALVPAAPLHAQLNQPADAAAKVPPVSYRSAFTDYRPMADQKPAPWKQVNKEVEGAGMGHGAHAAPKPEDPGATKGTSADRGPTKPAATPHHKH